MGELVEEPVFGEKALQEIVGEQLSAVTFVMDYVQLAFDGPMINAYAWPTCMSATARFGEGISRIATSCVRGLRSVSSRFECHEKRSKSPSQTVR